MITRRVLYRWATTAAQDDGNVFSGGQTMNNIKRKEMIRVLTVDLPLEDRHSRLAGLELSAVAEGGTSLQRLPIREALVVG